MRINSTTSTLHALVFDSGVGGLSVSADIRAHNLALRQSYLADDAFRPYGEKSEAALRARLPDLLRPVCDMLRPDIVVIACNTASTTALPAIRAALDVPVVGVVPAIKPAAALSKTRAIAVLGTPGTVRRHYVDDLIARFATECEVRLVGSLGLVQQAEAKLAGRGVDVDVLRQEIAPIFAGPPDSTRVDAVVLACTHFPLLVDDLDEIAPHPVTWVDSGAAIARRVAHLLKDALPKAAPPIHDTAFLTGADDSPARRATFARYGFRRTVSLMEQRAVGVIHGGEHEK